MPVARPRTISLPPDEMIELGKEMVEWVKQNKPLHLSQFYCIEKGYTDKEWDTMHVRQEFVPYYEMALKMVGLQYLEKDSPIDNSVKQRWQRVYFKDLKKDEDDLVKLKAELARKKEDEEHDASARSIAQAVAEISKDRQGVSNPSEPRKPEVADGESLLDQEQAG